MGFSWVWFLRDGKIWCSSWTWLYNFNPSCSLSEKERSRRKQISERVKVTHSCRGEGAPGVSWHWTSLKLPVRCTKSKHVGHSEGLFLMNWTLYVIKVEWLKLERRFCFLFNKSLIEVVRQGCVVASGQQSPKACCLAPAPSPGVSLRPRVSLRQVCDAGWQPGTERKGTRAEKIPCHLRSAPVSSLRGRPTQHFCLLRLN